MFSEINASINAESLEKVLLAAMRQKNKEVLKFVHKHIIPLYENEVGEAWGSYVIPEDIKKGFNLK